jgi:hypothetical protein
MSVNRKPVQGSEQMATLAGRGEELPVRRLDH